MATNALCLVCRLSWVLLAIGRLVSGESSSLQLTVGHTWDGSPVNQPATLTLASGKTGLLVTVQAKFWNNPGRPSGPKGAFFRLWDYEVVELFLLNDAGQYLEVELGAWGHHLVLLLDGGKDLRHSLPLNYTAARTGDQWTGSALIPTAYIPPNISRVNAYAIHGHGHHRQFEALYPAPSGAHSAPNFHRLEYFQPVELANTPTKLSGVWREAMEGRQSYSIALTWDGQPIDHAPAKITMRGVSGDLEISISAPYFGDPAPEGGKPGETYWQLWEHEVVEAFFLNNQEQYLELEFGPHGQHLMLILNGNRNAIKHSLPMDYSARIEGSRWEGEARVPGSYFPPGITRWNAYAIHGPPEARRYEALFESSGPQADFHRLEKFRPLELGGLLVGNKGSQLSHVWLTALQEEKVKMQ